MKSRHNGSGDDPTMRKEEDLPVFESLRPTEPTRRAERVEDGAEQETPTDFQSLMAGVGEKPSKKPEASTDFATLEAEVGTPLKRYQRRTFSDFFVAFLTPFLIFVMVTSVVYFLLDVRYVYTEVMDANIRWTAFFFVLGIVALNRLVAVFGKDESMLYMFGMFTVVALYTVGMQAYDVGSVAGSFMAGPWALVFNVCLVAFLWWLANRLTHECCIDTHPEAGNVGILTGTARRVWKRVQRNTPSKESGQIVELMSPVDTYRPFMPSEWKKPEKKTPVAVAPADERLGKRHPGISVFFFSVPVMVVFALGQRVVQNGGPRMMLAGHFYVGCYTIAALLLLMLTSLAQLREYFRARRMRLPAGLSIFWISLGAVMVVMVAFGATALPRPHLPPLAHVIEHQYDPWSRGSTFRLLPVTASPSDIAAQSRSVEYVGYGVLTLLGLFVAYAALRGVGAVAFSMARQRERYPRFVVRFFNRLDHLLIRIARLPRLPRLKRRIRIGREVSSAVKFSNPLADSEQGGRMTTAELIAYAYDALCALAYDLGVPRRGDQTPYEFIESFPKELSFLQDEAIELTHLYVLSNYGEQVLDDKVLDRLRKFWINFERFRAQIVR